jgi:hypothetical protein
MHLDGEDFEKLLASTQDYKAMAAVLAPAIHATYLSLASGRPASANYKTTYEKLPGDIKSDNLAAAIRIPEILSLIGLTVVKKTSANDKTDKQTIALIEQHTEILAKAEHDGWMAHKLMYGWRYGVPRDNVGRVQPALQPYDKLDTKVQDMDRNSVKHFADMVDLAGYKIAGFPDV